MSIVYCNEEDFSTITPAFNLFTADRLVVIFAQPHKTNNIVIPAKAGIQYYQWFPGYPRHSPGFGLE